ncbi:MAG: hypothetical protein Q4B59_04580 [Lachnospiraceae bacterium]|nr:hypothetical protein [Lachnospiraceae bacterium]
MIRQAHSLALAPRRRFSTFSLTLRRACSLILHHRRIIQGFLPSLRQAHSFALAPRRRIPTFSLTIRRACSSVLRRWRIIQGFLPVIRQAPSLAFTFSGPAAENFSLFAHPPPCLIFDALRYVIAGGSFKDFFL